MNLKFYPLRAMLLFLMLFGIKAGVHAQAVLDFVKTVENYTTGGNGTSASPGDELIYTITITNLTSQNFVAAKMYDNVPAGVSYIHNSTTLNDDPVPDVNGKMPYAGSGSAVRSPNYGLGILAPGATATIIFRVQVTANGGSIFNNATIDATQNGVATIQATNTVYTTLTPDAACNVVYQVTPSSATSASNVTHNYIRTVNLTPGEDMGEGGPTLFNGTTGPQREALPPNAVINHPSFWTPGVHLLNGSAAIAYDRGTNRIYFVNNEYNPQPDLCYINLSTSGGNPVTAYRFTGYKLETNTAQNYNINRMGMGSDGYCYALTSNARDLIRFRILPSGLPDIQRMGSLVNAATNGNKNVTDEKGGDIFADGSGKLYLIANSSNMYKINPDPNSLVATYMGRVNNYPNATDNPTQSLAITAEGDVYINGGYNDVWRVDLQSMEAIKINDNSTNVFQSGDYTACGFPVLASSIIADKTYRNINGSPVVNGGDTVEYIITVTNIGNINAAGVYMYDYIPPSTVYVPNTTRMNGISVADVNGVMPFAVSGGRLVNSPGEDPGIILPTDPNAAVVTFQVVTEPNKQVCNQSRITLLDADGNVMFVNSSDPGNIGQTPTCFYSDGVLPLNNLKFKGSLNGERSVLNWTMNGDEAVDYYEVQYSDNGTSFRTTGKVVAKGHTNAANSYTYTDNEHTFSTVRYYRLKVVQKGGTYTYSGIVRLNVKDLEIEAVPNPFDRDINVQVRLKTAETIRIRLIDFYGREVYSTVEQLSVGSHSIAIRIPAGLAKGMYVLDVRSGSEQILQKKLIKK